MDQLGNAHADKAMAAVTTVGVHERPHEQQRFGFGPLWHFIRHFVEMVVAMMLGMAIWGAIFGMALGPTTFGDTIRATPELRYGFMAIFMAIPMVLLMRYRRHSWERSWEMAGAMIAPMAVVILCWRLGLGDYVPFVSDRALGGSAHTVMLLGMLALMLYRRKEYAHAGPHIAGVHTSPQAL